MAPRRVPPCFTASVAASKIFKKESGPLATPLVLRTRSPAGRSRSKAKPVPPPVFCTRAICFSEVKIPSMLSSTGNTKQALSCCRSLPAFINVGELGIK